VLFNLGECLTLLDFLNGKLSGDLILSGVLSPNRPVESVTCFLDLVLAAGLIFCSYESSKLVVFFLFYFLSGSVVIFSLKTVLSGSWKNITIGL